MAEALIGAGLRVWFAEYQVLLENYEAFERAIEDGVRRSAHAVAFTNARFVSSPHCRRELDLLFAEEGPGADETLEIKIPDERHVHQVQPTLAACRNLEPTWPWDAAAVSQVLAFIWESFGLNGSPPIADDGTRGQPSSMFTDQIKGYSLDTGRWEVLSEGGSLSQTPFAGGSIVTCLRGPTLQRRFGGRKATVDLRVGIGTVAPRMAPSGSDIIDERRSFTENRAFATEYFQANALRAAGVHLLFLQSTAGRFSHLALTYWFRLAWVRRYSVILPDPLTGTSTEFAFAFRFSGPFKELCKSVQAMDDLVLSLRWPGPPVDPPLPDPRAEDLRPMDPDRLLDAARAKAWKPDAFWTAFEWFQVAFERLNLSAAARATAAQRLKPLVKELEHTLPHKALAVTCEALALMSEDARTWRFGASVLTLLGKHPEAEVCAERAVKASSSQELGRSWTFLADCRRERAFRDPALSTDARHQRLLEARAAAQEAIRLGDQYGAQMLQKIEHALRTV